MEIKRITENKKRFLDLLLLADEQENMIDRYIERGDCFALYDDDLKSICVVTDEGDGTFELQNLATYEPYQGQGYGRQLIRYICQHYQGTGRKLIVGTGNSPLAVSFYEHCGFTVTHVIKNYILEHYDQPIFENGVQLTDKVYLAMDLS